MASTLTAAGPYSQAILPTKSGLTPLFVAGQIPADATGALIEGSVADKTRMCCQNLKAIIEAAGGDLSKVVRCGVSPSFFLYEGCGWVVLVG